MYNIYTCMCNISRTLVRRRRRARGNNNAETITHYKLLQYEGASNAEQ